MDILTKELKEISIEYREKNNQKKILEKDLDTKKVRIKEIFEALGENAYKDDDVNVYQTITDKSYLDEANTLKFLKEHGLEKYIKTKEYFEPDELTMAILNKEIDASELAQFKVDKKEIRLYVK